MKLISLTQGKFAKVDDEDFERLSKRKWYYAEGYAARTIRIYKTCCKHMPMSNEILDVPIGSLVDHVNRDRLDNQRINLRRSNRGSNMFNRGPSKNNTSGYKGVNFAKKEGKWYAQIMINYKRISLGTFKTPEEAAQAYDTAAIKYFGEFAWTNLNKEIL